MTASAGTGGGSNRKRGGQRPSTITGRHKVAIAGYTWTVAELPWGDPTWEVWGMNDLWRLQRPGNVDMPANMAAGDRVHAWFDLHEPATLAADEAHAAWLRAEHPFPVVMFHPGALGGPAPSVLPYPEERLRAWVAAKGLRYYFTNTVAWQIALAAVQLEGVPGAELGVWGIDMAVGTEYAAQRPSCEYWLGVAQALGITVTLPPSCDLLATAAQYGLGAETDPMTLKLRQMVNEQRSRINDIRAQVAHIDQQRAQLVDAERQHVGAESVLSYLVNTRTQPHRPNRDAAPAGVPPVVAAAQAAAAQSDGLEPAHAGAQ
jgi:hypothetical protein